jgi:hypothetical protein
MIARIPGMKPLASMLLMTATLIACDSAPDSADRVFGTQDERAREQEQLNAISEQDDANNADAGITNDAQMEPLNP